MIKNEYVIITTTFNNKEEANKLIKLLLDEKLVSCCQLSNIESSYYWENKIVNEKEYLVKMKTKKELYKEVEEVILSNHSYSVPEIICYPIIDGSSSYLEWINDSTKVKVERI